MAQCQSVTGKITDQAAVYQQLSDTFCVFNYYILADVRPGRPGHPGISRKDSSEGKLKLNSGAMFSRGTRTEHPEQKHHNLAWFYTAQDSTADDSNKPRTSPAPIYRASVISMKQGVNAQRTPD